MSNEFRRLLDDAPSAELRATLESGLRDQPSPRTLGRAARALGIGAAGIGSARAAAAAGGLRAARAPLWGALAKLGATGVVSAPTASIARDSASTTAEPSTATKPRADFLDSEVSLLDAARTARKRNDPNAALLQLNHHAQLAGATLGAEATLLRVQALVLSGRSAEARDVARAALNGKNGGPYAERLRKISGLNE